MKRDPDSSGPRGVRRIAGPTLLAGTLLLTLPGVDPIGAQPRPQAGTRQSIAVVGSIVDVSSPGSSEAGPAAPSSFQGTVEWTDRSIYFGALQNGDAENWFGPVVSTAGTDVEITLANIDATTPNDAQIEVRLQGVTNTAVDQDHRVGVIVNGTEVGELLFDGQALGSEVFTMAQALLQEGANTVRLEARAGDSDISLIDVVRLTYWHTYRADANTLQFTAEGQQYVLVQGFDTGPIRVVDITDAAAASELPATAVDLNGVQVADDSADGGSLSVLVQAPGSGTRSMLAFTDSSVLFPDVVEPNQPTSWHAATQAADYVVITHADFVGSLDPLITLRQQQGYSPAVIDVEDLYDEFSFGRKDPQAIKDFLAHAVATWQTPPRLVLLVGDATLDPRDYAGLGNADFVPTKLIEMASVELETASDDWFVDADDDGLPELAVGRLPVRTVTQADAIVSKIVGYEAAPAESWASQVLLVADANDETSNFEAATARLKAELPGGYSGNEVLRGVLGTDGARAEILSRIDQGQLLVNYLGHGSTQVWGQSGDLMTGAEVPTSWTNASRLPFVVAMNCLNGFFHGIYGEESLAEALIRAPNGGAVAAWASSALTSAATQVLVNQELFRLVFQGVHATLGEAAAAAKQVVGNRDVRRSWIYFGDPATRLKGVAQQAAGRAAAAERARSIPLAGRASVPASGRPAQYPSAEQVTRGPAGVVRLLDFSDDGRDDPFLYDPDTGLWYLATSTGPDFAYASGQWRHGATLLAAALNGDTLADLLVYDAATGQWAQALNAGNGAFELSTGTWGPGWAVALGDLDGDRVDDVLLHRAGAARPLLASSTGAFVTREAIPLPSGALQVADFDADQRADVLVHDTATGEWSVGLSDGRGGFVWTAGQAAPGWAARVGQLDANAWADLLFFDPVSGRWHAWLRGETGSPESVHGVWPVASTVSLVDLDRDGLDDLVRADAASGRWVVSVNRGRAAFVEIATGAEHRWPLAVGDLSGDGSAELLAYDASTGAWHRASIRSRIDGSLDLVGDQTGTWSLGWIVVGEQVR